jgi:adenylate cyclase
VFAEPDRLSPPEIARELTGLPRALAEQLAGLPASEPDLADALRAVPTVLALAPERENEAAAPRLLHPAPIRQAGSEASAFLREYKSLLASLPELGAAAQSAGASVVEPDDDGIVRRVALAGSFRGTIIPAFALEVVFGSVGSPFRRIRTVGRSRISPRRPHSTSRPPMSFDAVRPGVDHD